MNVQQGFHEAAVALPDRRWTRRRIIWTVAIAIAVIVAVALWFGSSGKAPPPAPADLPRVTVIVPGRTDVVGTITATGNLGAKREMPVGIAGEGGMVTRVLVEPGDWVAAGQVLATVERSVQREEAAAQGASIDVARAEAALAQAELDRAKALVARGFISKADIDRRTATRDQAVARVKVAQATLGQTRARIGRLDVRAPAAGLVLARAVEPGQIVGPANGALFRLAKGGQMELLARMSEQDLARLSVGRPAEVTPVGTSQRFAGRIWQMPPIIDPQSRQGLVRIELPYNSAIRPGGFASAAIHSGTVQAPLLPESAIQNDEKGAFVLIVGPNGVVQRRDVKTGDTSAEGIAVLSGLSGTEKVVLSAGGFLNPGEKVIPERAKARG
ncbi:efflux RND transporter periplasmic adaptor subunit [Sphingomonas sp. ID0503]|uniref:efflux RND transporter periplasmic adaptor subunit n=1 Tax=Sphingomonas sp. ID0503 TaxID=3399691 RepID=UPI003AFB3A13